MAGDPNIKNDTETSSVTDDEVCKNRPPAPPPPDYTFLNWLDYYCNHCEGTASVINVPARRLAETPSTPEQQERLDLRLKEYMAVGKSKAEAWGMIRAECDVLDAKGQVC